VLISIRDGRHEDSETGATLGYATDQRRTQPRWSNDLDDELSNRSDFGALFQQWADICVGALQDLKNKSPPTAPEPKPTKN